MTHEQHLRLIEISCGLFATLDAMDTLDADKETAIGLASAALALSRALKSLVDELTANGGKP
jgi:hypothetical protein